MGEKEKVLVTNKVVIFGGQFWSKLDQTPCQNDLHSYWLHKLARKLDSTMKKVRPVFTTFMEELGEKYGKKGADGKVVFAQNGLPQADPAHQDAYSDMLDEFMQRTNSVEFSKLPLEYFSHIQKTPMDWEPLEMVAVVSPAILEEKSKNTSAVHEALHAINGGHSG